jgi:hypothetical protein
MFNVFNVRAVSERLNTEKTMVSKGLDWEGAVQKEWFRAKSSVIRLAVSLMNTKRMNFLMAKAQQNEPNDTTKSSGLLDIKSL